MKNISSIFFLLLCIIINVQAQDECVNATALTVGVMSCPGGGTMIDINNFTDSPNNPSCDNTGTNPDAWFSFVAPAIGIVDVTITGGDGVVEMAVFDACGGNEVFCNTNSNNLITGLVGGNTYILNIWEDVNGSGLLEVCLQEPPPPPTNDECVNAIALTVNPMNSCPGNGTMIDLSNATDSPNNPSCDNTGTNIDAWFSFVAPMGGALQVTVNGGDGNVEAAIFDACGGNEVFCDGAVNGDLISGLVAGNTYILNIWEDVNGSGSLEVCLQEPPPPPSNTNCADAIDLGLIGPTGFCPNGLIMVDNTNGTASPISSTNCDTGANTDLFYTFTVPASGNIQFLANTTSGTGVEAAILEDCSGNTELFCDASINGEVVTGLTPGDVLYVQFYQDTPGFFSFCIQEPPPPPINDAVNNAIPLCVGQTLNATNNEASTGLNEPNIPSCIGSLENTVWFSFEADNVGTPITITVGESPLCDGNDLQVVILSGPVNGPYLEEDCDASSTPYTVSLAAPTPNMTYWLYIDGNAGAQCDFTIDIVGAAPCCGPEIVVTPACRLGTEDAFFVDLAITDLGDNPSGYTVNSGAFPNITAIGNYQIGPFPNGTATVNLLGLDITCDVSFNLTQSCACIDSTIYTSSDTTICIGEQANLEAFLGDVIQIDTGTYTVITSAAGSCTAVPMGTITTETLGDDDVSNAIPLPFTFEFFGVPFNDFFISSNGFVSFGNGSTDLSQDPIPSPTAPNNIIALFWDDLDPVPTGTIIHFPSIVNNQNCYVVEFQDVEHFPGGNNNPTVSGQIIMCEDGTITINCIDCQVAGDVMGQGIENADGSLGYFDPSLPNGETNVDLMNCVTFVPDAQSMTCDFLYWITDLNDPAGSQVSMTQTTSVSPMITTTYYAVSSCNNTLFCTDSVTVDFGGLDCIECLSVVRVCDGNALYVTEDDSVEFPLPLVPNSAWVYEWYLDGVLEATVVGDSYYNPTNIGTYTVFVSNPNNGTSTQTISPCNSLTIDEIIDCRDCGK